MTSLENKYKNKYFKLDEKPPKGMVVVYFPFYDAMIYLIHDAVYKNFHFKPGDIFTVEKIERSNHMNLVHVKENECLFSPAELIPAYLVDEKDRKEIVKIYKQKSQGIKYFKS